MCMIVMAYQISMLSIWMERGYVYEAKGYIIWDTHTHPLNCNPPPVHYPICSDFIKTGTDFPVWTPSVAGYESPWGKGMPTVNLEYVASILMHGVDMHLIYMRM
jgi:cysteinyl-tRNA synthetase